MKEFRSHHSKGGKHSPFFVKKKKYPAVSVELLGNLSAFLIFLGFLMFGEIREVWRYVMSYLFTKEGHNEPIHVVNVSLNMSLNENLSNAEI